MKIGSLFTGAGGLDIAVEEVLGAETVWRSDIKPAACTLIDHYWPGTNLGDITAIDWAQVEPVDIITGGFPCTDISAAGKQAGLIRYGDDKTRSGLWAEMCRAVATIRPSLMVAENVRALTSVKADSNMEPCAWCVGDAASPDMRALGAVLADLADIGYDAAWCGLRAADVGAPHGRFRIFIVATDTDGERLPKCGAGGSSAQLSTTAGRGSAAADAGSEAGNVGAGLRPSGQGGQRRGRPSDSDAPAAADTERIRSERRGVTGDLVSTPGAGEADREQRQRHGDAAHQCLGRDRRAREARRNPGRRAPVAGNSQIDWGDYAPAIRRWETIIGRPAPHPTETGTKGGQRLSAVLTEWMMGWPEGWTDVPGLSRAQRLSLCGDGVVPQQAAAALRYLLPQIQERAA